MRSMRGKFNGYGIAMKIYCKKCKKVFTAEKPENGNQVPCTFCGEKTDFPESPSSVGAVIGDFLIEQELNKGGMGEVYLARQLSLDRPVALKVLQPKFLNDKEYVDSFFREARAAGRISHPNVVQAYAVGEENGIFYFAMEYIRGRTMKEILKEEKTIEFRKAAKIIREIASALECAWRDEKLVHQDIKPDNIMLDANGFAKLADLGLARVAGVNDKEASEGDEVLGTPQYISPEQLTGVPTDVRSDLYSLGATFYHFVTGRFPYVADSADEIAKMHVAGNLQPPKEVNPNLPDELNTIILKMMARRIEDRYQTPAALIKALDLYLQNSAPSGPGSMPHLNFRRPGTGTNGTVPRTPFRGGGTKSPFASGNRTPFAAGRASSATPAANSQKPAGTFASAELSGDGREASIPPANALGKQADGEKLPGKDALSLKTVSKEEDALALKVVSKATPSSSETPDESEKGGKAGQRKKERKRSARRTGNPVMSLLVVLVVLGGLGLGFYFLAEGKKLPSAIQPYGDKLVSMIHPNKADDQTAGSTEGSELPNAEGTQEPTEPKIETRSEYLTAIDTLLERFSSNPDDSASFLEGADRFFQQFPNAQTKEEALELERLLRAFHPADETARVAPVREALHAEFTAALSKRHAAAELAEQELAEKQERERQQRERAEAEEKRLARERAERDAEANAAAEKRLAKIMPKLQLLFGKVANSFLIAVRTGNMDEFNRDLAELRIFPFVPGESAEEMRIQNQINAFGSNLLEEQKTLRAFVERLDKISPRKDSFSIEMPNRDLLTVTSVKPNAVIAVNGLGEKRPFDLSDPRIRTIFIQRLERRLKLQNPGFYLDLMTGNFSQETNQEASNYAFWKTYYSPFMTAYFFARLHEADSAAKTEMEKRYGTLPEFRAALELLKQANSEGDRSVSL